MNMEARSLSQTRIPLPSPPLRPRHLHKQHGHFHVAAVLTSPPDNLSGVAQRTSTRRRSDNSAVILTEKNAYNDNMFEQMAIDHLSHSVQAATGLRNNKKGYESLVQAASDASRKFTLAQQRELILLALARAIPKPILDLIKTVTPASKFSREYFAAFTTLFFAWLIGPCELRESEFNGRREKNVVHIKKCRFLEETNCVGMCTNLCKVPSQTFIKDSLGMPVSMVPNFDDMSCEMIFGQDPPPLTEDPAFNQPCYKLCKSNKSHSLKCPS